MTTGPPNLFILIGTPDSLDGISESGSVYSNPTAVKSRAERNAPNVDWGTEDTWFKGSKATLTNSQADVSKVR